MQASRGMRCVRVIPEKGDNQETARQEGMPSELVSEGQRSLKAKTKLSNNTLGFYQ